MNEEKLENGESPPTTTSERSWSKNYAPSNPICFI